MQSASGTIMTVSMASSDRDQRPWVAAQKAAGGVINAGRISFNGNNGKIFVLSSVSDVDREHETLIAFRKHEYYSILSYSRSSQQNRRFSC